MTYFYDTSELLISLPSKEDKIVISNITWQELKQIKDNKNKTDDVRRRAQRAISALTDIDFIKVDYNPDWAEGYDKKYNDDDRILLCADLYYNYRLKDDEDFVLITHDKAMYLDAIDMDIPVVLTRDTKEETYKGFREYVLSNEEWIDFYERDEFYDNLVEDMFINEYLIIHYYDNENKKRDYCAKKVIKIIDGEKIPELEEIGWPTFNSSRLGEMKPKDCYQRCAMDSLNNADFTILRGLPGSGKTLAALSYLMDSLEHNEIDKIYMLVNPVATRDSAKLGYLPGDKNSKILDSSIGSLLAAKFGDRIGVDYLIESGKLELLPVSDIRGVSIPANAACYVTEGQNLTIDLAKLIIQRCDEGCKIIIEGDNDAQVDMQVYDGKNNGLRRAVEVFKGEDFFSTVTLEEIHRSRAAKVAEQM